MKNLDIQAVANEVYQILLENNLTVRQASEVMDVMRQKVFENIQPQREALNNEKIK